MTITLKELRQYLKDNALNTRYPIGVDNYFTFKLIENFQDSEMPYSIQFSSPKWSKTTVSYVGPENIKRYLDIFNRENDPPASAYKNRDGQGSQSKNARYLRKLFNLIADS